MAIPPRKLQTTLGNFLTGAPRTTLLRVVPKGVGHGARCGQVSKRSIPFDELLALFSAKAHIVACVGSRAFSEKSSDEPRVRAQVHAALAAEHERCPIACVVTGGALGPDSWGAEWALSAGIPVREYLTEFSSLGNSAGMVRNSYIIAHATRLLAFPASDPQRSSGTRNVIASAGKLDNMIVTVIEIELGGEAVESGC